MFHHRTGLTPSSTGWLGHLCIVTGFSSTRKRPNAQGPPLPVMNLASTQSQVASQVITSHSSAMLCVSLPLSFASNSMLSNPRTCPFACSLHFFSACSVCLLSLHHHFPSLAQPQPAHLACGSVLYELHKTQGTKWTQSEAIYKPSCCTGLCLTAYCICIVREEAATVTNKPRPLFF